MVSRCERTASAEYPGSDPEGGDLFSGWCHGFERCFCRSKSGVAAPGEVRITRFIMNMTPSNAYQVLMRGDLLTLSSASNWASIVLPQDHCLLWSSDDQKGAFYAWKLPPAWRGLMTFRWPVPGSLLWYPSEWAYVCSKVIPMGWLNAVSLFQHLHRQLGLQPPPAGAGFQEWQEVAT